MENNNHENDKILMKVSGIIKKVKTKEVMVNVMREKGKTIIYKF